MLIQYFFSTGYAGSAEPAVPLSDDESIAQVGDGTTRTKESIKDKLYETGSTLAFPQTEGLSPMMKFFLIACIILACYMFLRAHSSRRGLKAGRHGAYEKSLP